MMFLTQYTNVVYSKLHELMQILQSTACHAKSFIQALFKRLMKLVKHVNVDSICDYILCLIFILFTNMGLLVRKHSYLFLRHIHVIPDILNAKTHSHCYIENFSLKSNRPLMLLSISPSLIQVRSSSLVS